MTLRVISWHWQTGDIRAFRKLVDDPEIDEATIGFLAQQAIEKCLKATLARYNRDFRRTHDLAELLDILADAQGPLPPHADSLDELNPYAVEFRYGFVEPIGLDRDAVKVMVEAVRAWAEQPA